MDSLNKFLLPTFTDDSDWMKFFNGIQSGLSVTPFHSIEWNGYLWDGIEHLPYTHLPANESTARENIKHGTIEMRYWCMHQPMNSWAALRRLQVFSNSVNDSTTDNTVVVISPFDLYTKIITDLSEGRNHQKFVILREDGLDVQSNQGVTVWWRNSENSSGRFELDEAACTLVEFPSADFPTVTTPSGFKQIGAVLDVYDNKHHIEGVTTYECCLNAADSKTCIERHTIDYSKKLIIYGAVDDWECRYYFVNNAKSFVVNQLVELKNGGRLSCGVVAAIQGHMICVLFPVGGDAIAELQRVWGHDYTWSSKAQLLAAFTAASTATTESYMNYVSTARKNLVESLEKLNSADALSAVPVSEQVLIDASNSFNNVHARLNSGVPVGDGPAQIEYAEHGKGYTMILTEEEICTPGYAKISGSSASIIASQDCYYKQMTLEYGAIITFCANAITNDYTPYAGVIIKDDNGCRPYATGRREGAPFVVQVRSKKKTPATVWISVNRNYKVDVRISNRTFLPAASVLFGQQQYFTMPSSITDTWEPQLVDADHVSGGPNYEGLIIPADVTDRFQITTTACNSDKSGRTVPSYAVFASRLTDSVKFTAFSDFQYESAKFVSAGSVYGQSRTGYVADIKSAKYKLQGRALFPGYTGGMLTSKIPDGTIFYFKLDRTMPAGTYRCNLGAYLAKVAGNKIDPVTCRAGFSSIIPTADWNKSVDPTPDPDTKVTVSTILSDDSAGTITGAGFYMPGAAVTCEVNLNDGWEIMSWSGEYCQGFEGRKLVFVIPITVSVGTDIQIRCNVRRSSTPSTKITVVKTGAILNGSITYDSTVDPGSYLVCSATPNEGYQFEKWIGTAAAYARDPTSLNPSIWIPESVAPGTELTIGATFTKKPVKWVEIKSHAPISGKGLYPVGSTVALIAQMVSQNSHVVWSGKYGAPGVIDLGYVLTVPDVPEGEEVWIEYTSVDGMVARSGLTLGTYADSGNGYTYADKMWLNDVDSTTIRAVPRQGYKFVKWNFPEGAPAGLTVDDARSAETVLHFAATGNSPNTCILTATFAVDSAPLMAPARSASPMMVTASAPMMATARPMLDQDDYEATSTTEGWTHADSPVSLSTTDAKVLFNVDLAKDCQYFYITVPFFNVEWTSVPYSVHMISLDIEAVDGRGQYECKEKSTSQCSDATVVMPTYSTLQCYLCVNCRVDNQQEFMKFRVAQYNSAGDLRRVFTYINLPNRLVDETVSEFMKQIQLSDEAYKLWQSRKAVSDRLAYMVEHLEDAQTIDTELKSVLNWTSDTNYVPSAYLVKASPTSLTRSITDQVKAVIASNSFWLLNECVEFSDKFRTKLVGGDGVDRSVYVTLVITAVSCKVWVNDKEYHSGDVLTFIQGEYVKLVAEPNDGYLFTGWMQGTSRISDSKELVYKMTRDTYLSVEAYDITWNVTLKFNTARDNQAMYVWGFGNNSEGTVNYHLSEGPLTGYGPTHEGDKRNRYAVILCDEVRQLSKDPKDLGIRGTAIGDYYYTRAVSFAVRGDHSVIGVLGNSIDDLYTETINMNHVFHGSMAYEINMNWFSESKSKYDKYTTEYMFTDCVNLTHQTLYVPELGTACFSGCSSISAVSHNKEPEGVSLPNVTRIKDNGFYKCVGIKDADLSKVTFVGNSVFAGCESLETASLPKVTLEQGSESGRIVEYGKALFSGCKALTNVNISAAVVVPSDCFNGCLELTKADVHLATWIGNNAFRSCNKVRKYAADGKASMSDVHFGNVTYIGGGAFAGSAAANNIYLPELTTIGGEYAFQGLYSCPTVNESSNVGVWIPKVTVLPGYTFADCVGLQTGDLELVTEVGAGCFSNCAIVEVSTMEHYNNMYIPHMTIVPDNCFMNCRALIRARLQGVTELGESAFAGCASILEMSTIDPECDFYAPDITRLPKNLFSDCALLMKVEIPGITDVDEGCFAGCLSFMYVSQSSRDANVFMPDVTELKLELFNGCVTLTGADLRNVTSIADNVFTDCSALERISDTVVAENCVYLPSVRDMSGTEIFMNCYHLTDVKLDNVTSVGTRMFVHDYGLTYVSMRSLTAVDSEMFLDCNNLRTLEVAADVTGSIGSRTIESRIQVTEGGKTFYRYTLVLTEPED